MYLPVVDFSEERNIYFHQISFLVTELKNIIRIIKRGRVFLLLFYFIAFQDNFFKKRALQENLNITIKFYECQFSYFDKNKCTLGNNFFSPY